MEIILNIDQDRFTGSIHIGNGVTGQDGLRGMMKIHMIITIGTIIALMLTNGPCTDIKKKDKEKVKESEIYMENCRIIWSYNDYTTDDERIEGIKTSIGKLNTALKDYTVDIDTYKSQIRSFDEKVKHN